MSIIITDYELNTALRILLQQQANFCLNNKIWRNGKILLFKQSGFFIEFIIKNEKKKQERFEIPIPFGVEYNKDTQRIYFNYKLKCLTGDNIELLKLIKSLTPIGKNKFFDTTLEIQITT